MLLPANDQDGSRARSAKRITKSIASVILERHARVRPQHAPPVQLAAGSMQGCDDDVGFTICTVDARGDLVSHHVVVDREGRVRRIVTPGAS